mgnify:CR=1 FL=1|tara:strand:- start:969 stop:1160 length:192 start_codon:yes stop_codon:yes gene_type:complete
MKKYILTIEYNDKTEEIEYVQEEIVDDLDSPEEIIRELNMDGYFDEESLERIITLYSGKIGIS